MDLEWWVGSSAKAQVTWEVRRTGLWLSVRMRSGRHVAVRVMRETHAAGSPALCAGSRDFFTGAAAGLQVGELGLSVMQ